MRGIFQPGVRSLGSATWIFTDLPLWDRAWGAGGPICVLGDINVPQYMGHIDGSPQATGTVWKVELFGTSFSQLEPFPLLLFRPQNPQRAPDYFHSFRNTVAFFIFSSRVINLLTALKRKNVVLGRLSFCLLSLPPTNWLANEQIFFLCSSISQLFDLQVGRGETAGWQTAKRNKNFAGDVMAALAAPSFCAFPLLLHPIGLVVFII